VDLSLANVLPFWILLRRLRARQKKSSTLQQRFARHRHPGNLLVSGVAQVRELKVKDGSSIGAGSDTSRRDKRHARTLDHSPGARTEKKRYQLTKPEKLALWVDS